MLPITNSTDDTSSIIQISSSTGPKSSNNKKSHNNNKRRSKQEQHDRIVASAKSLFTSGGFIVLVIFLIGTVCMSFSIGLFLLNKHESDIAGASSEGIGNNNNNNYSTEEEEVDHRKLDQQQQQQVVQPGSYNNNKPFTPIVNGEQLMKDVLAGTNPTTDGIIYLLQQFLRHLRHSNKLLRNVPNNRTGEDIVRLAYFNLAQQYLLPFDTIYRGRTIFPVRTKEDSIFISLAAYREHLLYETLAGAFGQAKDPDKLYVGIVMQNCFGTDDETGEEYECFTGVQVIGQDESGRPITRVSKASPDSNGVVKFCNDTAFDKYCTAGQLRIVYVHEAEALGPAVARYFASKLWGGETYFLQVDSHLQFTTHWDEHYKNEIKVTSNYPKSVLSMYPPGFAQHVPGVTPGTRLCACEFSDSPVEDHILRINNGMGYRPGVEYPQPTQIPFIAAGFFFTRGEFLQDIPFDPLLPWCFMGEELALSIRAWTSGWNIYAPRKNWIAHQYRPGRMGLPKFWETVGRTFKRGIGFSNNLQRQVIYRIKYMVGYPEITNEFLHTNKFDDVITDIQYYGLGTNRTREDYTKFTGINFETKQCPPMQWCNKGEIV